MSSEEVALAYLRSIDAHRDTSCFEAPCQNPIDVANAEIESWLHYLFDHLKTLVGTTGYQGSGHDFDMPDLKAIRVFSATGRSGPPLMTKLSLVRMQQGLFVFVSGEADVFSVEIEVWTAAIASALQRLSQIHPEHEWWAVLGPHRGMPGMMKPFVGAVDLDRLSLRTADFGYRETVPVSLRGMSKIDHWIPVIASGRSVGYDWNSATHAAHRDLYELAALLSLESGDHWTLRERPAPIAWGPPALSASVGPLERLTEDEEVERRKDAATIDAERLKNCWRELHRESRLFRPLSAYYEGVALLTEHPSFAVVAFVATIEEVGRLLVPPAPPVICPTCKRLQFGSSRRIFRETLELVRSKERAAELTNSLYPWRSATAHSGQLFGYETAFGNRPIRIARPLTVADTFDMTIRVRAQDAAKDLLHRALSGSLPPG